jgi:hypothetical protein
VLERAGLRASLSGTTLRVPGSTAAAAERALRAGGATAYRVRELPATLEERFFELAGPPGPAGQSAGAAAAGQRGPA